MEAWAVTAAVTIATVSLAVYYRYTTGSSEPTADDDAKENPEPPTPAPDTMGCGPSNPETEIPETEPPAADPEAEAYARVQEHLAKKRAKTKTPSSEPASAESALQTATFAAGCFWGVELAFQRVSGVVSTQVGYIGGTTENPTYKEVKKGATGHAEAVQLQYDPAGVSYTTLLGVFWNRSAVGGKFDPTKPDQQGNDKGSQYRSAIYWHTPKQQKAAEASLAAAPKMLGLKPWNKVYVEVVVAPTFYKAEDNHQQYLSEKGGRKGLPQCSSKGCDDKIRCYG